MEQIHTASPMIVFIWQVVMVLTGIVAFGCAGLFCSIYNNRALKGVLEVKMGLVLMSIFCTGLTGVIYLEMPIVG